MPRSADELIDRNEHAWPTVLQWLSASSRSVVVMPATPGGRQTLEALQVTTRSPMGAIAFESGGVLIDDGWLRLLGGSGPDGIGLLTWNGLRPHSEPLVHGALVVAIDVLGGLFVINDTAFPDGRGHVRYFGPDTLTWLDTDLGYTDFVKWSLGGDLDRFFGELRWPGWRDEVRPLTIDHGISIYPFPWASDGGPLVDRARRVVPITELAYIYLDTKRQLDVMNRPESVRVLFEDQ